jgi:hypothetical protein
MESPGVSADDRLSGWKEVAQYLKRGVRTAQRWEKELGLPVHRLKTKNGQVLYARRSELDAWITEHAASLSAMADQDSGPEVPAASGTYTRIGRCWRPTVQGALRGLRTADCGLLTPADK